MSICFSRRKFPQQSRKSDLLGKSSYVLTDNPQREPKTFKIVSKIIVFNLIIEIYREVEEMIKRRTFFSIIGCFILAGVFIAPTLVAEAITWAALPGYQNYSPCGLPDFNERQMDPENIYCGPTAVADVLWWFDSKHEVLSYPDGGGDTYSLVQKMGSATDDHSTANPPNLIDIIGVYGGTSEAIGGTYPWKLRSGIIDYISDKGLGNEYSVWNWVSKPSPSFLKTQIQAERGVVLWMQFYGSSPIKKFGHYVAVQAVCTSPDQMKISDPYLDNKDYHDTSLILLHNDAGIVNHDQWTLEPKPWYQSPLGSGYYQIQNWVGFRGVIISALVIEET